MPITPTEYERATAIVTHAAITRSVAFSYPDLSIEDRDTLILSIIERMARMRGYVIRREFADVDEGE